MALVVLLMVPATLAGSQSGTICIAPVTAKMREVDRGDPRGHCPPYTFDFSVQIDNGKRVSMPRDQATAVHGLDANTRHLVRIRDGATIIESFYFTFQNRGGRTLCLSYGPFYETWDLSPPGRRPWCRCK